MSKTQNKDLTNLGDIYSDVFNKVVVTEQKIPVGEIGSADLRNQRMILLRLVKRITAIIFADILTVMITILD